MLLIISKAKMLISFLQLCLLFGILNVQAQWDVPTIYDEIRESPDYSRFEDLLLSNPDVRHSLEFDNVTVFAPDDHSFDLYHGDVYPELAYYHACLKKRTFRSLRTTDTLRSSYLGNPPLWITKVGPDIYVNNAKVVQNRSSYVFPRPYQHQALHRIDRILNPWIRSPTHFADAYNFLRYPHQWNLERSKAVTKFHERVKENQLTDLFEDTTPKTFFIPVDAGIDPDKYKLMDKKVVLGHVVPNRVLFTRPSAGKMVTLVDDDGHSYELSFERDNDTMFVKCVSKYSIYKDTVEILVPDIPVQNGVIHLISKPFTNFYNLLRHFPYLPILEKIATDPEIDVFYRMGNVTKFNEIFNKTNVSFTYFIPKDSAWYKTSKLGLEPVDNFRNVLARHLVISKSPYTMEKLATMTRNNHYLDIGLQSEEGPLKISVFKIDGSYFIKWKRRYIKVVKANYVCSDGIVHILNGPMAEFRPKNSGINPLNATSYQDYWNIVKDIFT